MTDRSSVIRIGTRGSALARWQAEHVAALLSAAHPGLAVELVVITTQGDQTLDMPLPLIGGKGLFTTELERALREGAIDLAVHSLKDLPTDDPPGLTVGAVPRRGAVADALIGRAGLGLASLPRGAAVGTSSRRRAAQLASYRPDLAMLDIRGNVPTRIHKALDPAGPYDAIVLAYAGLERLGRLDAIVETIPLDVMLPAPGQGALGIQCRDDGASLALLQALNHAPTQVAVTAERAFLSALGGGCAVPIAAYATLDADALHLRGRVFALDGSRRIEVSAKHSAAAVGLDQARTLGHELAGQALRQGAADILEAIL